MGRGAGILRADGEPHPLGRQSAQGKGQELLGSLGFRVGVTLRLDGCTQLGVCVCVCCRALLWGSPQQWGCVAVGFVPLSLLAPRAAEPSSVRVFCLSLCSLSPRTFLLGMICPSLFLSVFLSCEYF